MKCLWNSGRTKTEIMHDSSIPEVERPVTAHDAELNEPQPGEKRKATNEATD